MIYFIQAGEGRRVKIGHTDGPVEARLAALQTGCPDTLRVLAVVEGTRADESWLHVCFSGLRVRGEWFVFGRPLQDFLRWLGHLQPGADPSGPHAGAVAHLKGLLGAWPGLEGNDREVIMLLLGAASRGMLGGSAASPA